ncbi:MAG: efflux RND transporter periplasmic adaptor subunit [Isosphaeraceae bacterium]
MAFRPSKQNLGLSALAVVAIGLLAWSFMPVPVEVDVARVSRGDLRVTVDHEGKTRVRERYVVSSPLGGRLVRIGLKPGERVMAGKTLLALIEPSDPALLDVRQRSQALARVDAAAAALKRAQSETERVTSLHDKALQDLERERKLRIRDVVSAETLEAAQAREQASAAEVRAAEFAVRVAAFELEQAQAALVHTRVASSEESRSFRFEVPAPIDGVVLRVFQESATIVTPGTRLLEVGDPTDLECEVDVLSTDAVRIMPGQRVQFERWGGPGTLEGRVRVREPSGYTKISALGVEEQRVNIIVDLTDPPEARPSLGDGYRVEARIVTWEGRGLLKVPSGALFRRDGEWTVFRIEEGRVHASPVKVGHGNGLETEILDGLKEGDRLVLHPSDKVAEGVAVTER